MLKNLGSAEAFGNFKEIVSQTTDIKMTPHAVEIANNIPVYDGAHLEELTANSDKEYDLLSEWTRVFSQGAGIIVIRNGIPDHSVLDRATEVFESLIDTEKEQSGGGGDHFAKAGANDRVWNALEKHGLADPANFAAYYGSNAIALASKAWLGRGYQMTAQVNRVNPGGAAQKPHRDYHLGFMSRAQMLEFPPHVHALSPVLTLQGAVAHCDMPLESGPTQFLPFSQMVEDGYLSFTQDAYQSYFQENFVQLPLNKGDMVFFNPAVMHGAGDNVTSDIYRMANLLQVSSAFGRAMETVNRTKLSKAIYPALLEAQAQGTLSARALSNAIGCCAEGYAFPTNLDNDPPVGGLAPKTQADIMTEALADQMSADELNAQLDALSQRQQS